MTAYRIAADATRDTGIADAPSRSAGSRNTTSTPNATTMPISARSPRHRATATTTRANTSGHPEQWPGPLVVVERVGGGAALVDLADDADVVAGHQIRLARAAAELQQGVRALVRPRVDRHQGLHASAPSPCAGTGSAVSTAPADGLPQVPRLVDTTWPPSVVTAPPWAFWKGSGMSTFCWLGHSSAALASTATPMAISRPTTIFAASGPSGAGPLREWEWAWECVTRSG